MEALKRTPDVNLRVGYLFAQGIGIANTFVQYDLWTQRTCCEITSPWETVYPRINLQPDLVPGKRLMVIHATADSQQYHPSLVESLNITFSSMRACKVYMSLPAANAARDASRSGGIIMAQTRTVYTYRYGSEC